MTTRTFPLTAPINLVARIGHGSLRVDAREGLTEASVTITSRNDASVLDRVSVEMRGSTLVVAQPRQGGIFDMIGRNRNRDEIDVEVVVPVATPVQVGTFTADIVLTGVVGHADLASGVATIISAEHVDGDLRLRYGSGSADIGYVRGNVQARSGSGSAHFGEVCGTLSSACGSGDVTVDTAHGSVRTRAGSGGASIGSVHGDVDFVSGSGSITVGVPAGLSARLDVTTGSGRVESDMPVESSATSTGRPVTVRIRTGSGDIRLIRAA